MKNRHDMLLDFLDNKGILGHYYQSLRRDTGLTPQWLRFDHERMDPNYFILEEIHWKSSDEGYHFWESVYLEWSWELKKEEFKDKLKKLLGLSE